MTRPLYSLFLLILFASINTFAHPFSSNEDTVDNKNSIIKEVELTAIKQGNIVSIHAFIKHPDVIAMMTLERSADFGDNYTVILTLNEDKMSKIKENQMNLIDKFPLPQTKNVYYRLVIEEKEGVLRMYPPTEMTIAKSAN